MNYSESIIDTPKKPQPLSSASPVSLSAKTLIDSPDYYPLKLEGANLLFVQMDRQSYAQSIFTLPNRIVTAANSAWSVPFAEVMNLLEQVEKPLTSPSYIYQIAHCGSTLLSRALDHAGKSLVIREPFTLRQYAAAPPANNPGDKAARQRALKAILRLLSRQYSNAEAVLIKANVPVNYCLSEIQQLAPNSAGILLYSTFEDYLVAVLKDDQRRLWAQHVVRELSLRICAISGFESLAIDTLSDTQATAVLWLTQISSFELALKNNHQLRSFCSDQLYQQPAASLTAAAKHLVIDINAERIMKVVNSDIFRQHAKNPNQRYSEAQRIAELDNLKSQYKDEINQTLIWCDKNNFDTRANLASSALLKS